MKRTEGETILNSVLMAAIKCRSVTKENWGDGYDEKKFAYLNPHLYGPGCIVPKLQEALSRPLTPIEFSNWCLLIRQHCMEVQFMYRSLTGERFPESTTVVRWDEESEEPRPTPVLV